jgi:DNA mismatch repair protein MutL
MMNKIKILQPEVYTRIAAGEVVERPSNVVKELIENSIDASSTEIIIEIVSSGRKLIRVIDNGVGMTKEDLLLSVKPHATSKIEKFEDIYNLSTLGFRGEALSSIANVSKLTIVSKTEQDQVGYQIVVHGGEILSLKECSCNKGTSVEVKDLFYNTPARLKFLKSDYTEKIHIARTIEEYAIVYPNISFKFYSDAELVLSTLSTTELLQRLKDVIKRDIVDNLIYFANIQDKLHIYGFVTPIEFSQVNKSLQMFYVNKRPVTSRILSQALYDAYRDALPTGRHPVGIIFINVVSDSVDVNVHPTKRVIKFKDENYIYEILKNLIKNKLKDFYTKQQKISLNIKLTNDSGVEQQQIIQEQKEISLSLSEKQKFELKKYQQQTELELKQSDKFITYEKLGLLNFVYLGQIHRTYLLFETQEGMVLIDQHAASERVLFEKFMKSKTIPVQKLLIPLNIELKPSDFETVKPYIELFNNLGFEATISGRSSLGFNSIPSLFNVQDVKDFVSRFIENFVDDIKNEVDSITSKEKIIRSACRAAIKANDLLTITDVNNLLSDLVNCDQPFFCPHGRPTIIKLEIEKIEKLFLRRK